MSPCVSAPKEVGTFLSCVCCHIFRALFHSVFSGPGCEPDDLPHYLSFCLLNSSLSMLAPTITERGDRWFLFLYSALSILTSYPPHRNLKHCCKEDGGTASTSNSLSDLVTQVSSLRVAETGAIWRSLVSFNPYNNKTHLQFHMWKCPFSHVELKFHKWKHIFTCNSI